MTKRDYENVSRILGALPVNGGVRLNAVVSACQLFTAANPKNFQRVPFAREAGCYPCSECDEVFANEDWLIDHQDDEHNKLKEVECSGSQANRSKEGSGKEVSTSEEECCEEDDRIT